MHIHIRSILIIKAIFFHLGKPNPPLAKVVQRWKQMSAFQESNTITDKEESESKHQNQKNIFDRIRDHAPLIVWFFFS